MDITANTTDEQIMSSVGAAKKTLAAQAENLGSEELARLVNGIAVAEGAAFANATYRDALQHGVTDPDTHRRLLAKLLLNGPDDGWSGRTNDVRRARFDGLRQRINDLYWEV